MSDYISSIMNMETNEMVAMKKIVNAFDNYTDAKQTLWEIRHLDHENVSVFVCINLLNFPLTANYIQVKCIFLLDG